MKKLYFKITTLCILSISLSACSNKQTPTTHQEPVQTVQQENKESEQVTNTLDNKVVSTLMGDVELPSNIERITVLMPHLNEDLYMLGIYPTASVCEGTTYPDLGFIENGSPHEIINLGWQSSSDNLNLESISDSNPDIIFASGSMVDSFDILSQIAPTIIIDYTKNEDGTRNWRPKFLEVANIFDMEQEALEMISEFDKQAEFAADEIADAIGDSDAMVLRVTAKDLRYYTAQGMQTLYTDLGVTEPYMIPSPDAMFEAIAAEQLLDINPDYLFVIAQDESEYQLLTDTPIWSHLDCVQNDQVMVVDFQRWFMGFGLVSSKQIIEDCKNLFIVQ